MSAITSVGASSTYVPIARTQPTEQAPKNVAAPPVVSDPDHDGDTHPAPATSSGGRIDVRA